jgi:hypothetical protein
MVALPLGREHQPLLNGFPYRLFRRSEKVVQRRQQGTFFSGSKLASELVRLLHSVLPGSALVMDPTCGMGDLLLAYADTLPLKSTLEATLMYWGERVAGIELRADLVEMTKLRLLMLARARGNFRGALRNFDIFFPLIIVGDMFDQAGLIRKADGYLFNPPFGQTSAHDVTEWSSGHLSAAALFLDVLVKAKRPQSPIAAVLPEVLRCGTRYARFRNRLSEAGYGGEFVSAGRFDSWTDVDVFTTLLSENVALGIWRSENLVEIEPVRVGDLFDVHVGAVVPHRHPKKGPWRRFACAKTAPAWAPDYVPKNSRRFSGTVFKPPFVVVRRTSSPSDKKRAVGTIVLGKKLVAVENHLIVLIPKDGRIESCLELLTLLMRSETTGHLNREIRCRHLTTISVKAIPWDQISE